MLHVGTHVGKKNKYPGQHKNLSGPFNPESKSVTIRLLEKWVHHMVASYENLDYNLVGIIVIVVIIITKNR